MTFTFTLSAIEEAVQKVYSTGKNTKVWAMHGDMGAGKTTFIYALCSYLGVTSTVSSPTYSIINEYTSAQAGKIYHMDWYRLKDEEEALQAGVEDSLFSGAFCIVEWPEKAAGLLPDHYLKLTIQVIDEQTRQITIQAL